MTVALIVRARAPATRGAGVRDAVTPGVRERDSEDVFAAGSVDPVNVGEIRARRYSYPSMYIAADGMDIVLLVSSFV